MVKRRIIATVPQGGAMAVPTPADHERLRTLFESHAPAIRAYAARRCARVDDIDDAVAETFTVAWRRLASVPLDAELPWLYGVARRVVANQRRGERRWLGLVARLGAQPRDVSTPPADGGPALEAFATLRPDDQELLRLVAWEELSHAEIATVLRISPNAVAIRLHRARKRLADRLAAMSPAGNEQPSAGHSTG